MVSHCFNSSQAWWVKPLVSVLGGRRRWIIVSSRIAWLQSNEFQESQTLSQTTNKQTNNNTTQTKPSLACLMTHVSHLNCQEAKAGGLLVQDLPGLQNELKIRLGNLLRPYMT